MDDIRTAAVDGQRELYEAEMDAWLDRVYQPRTAAVPQGDDAWTIAPHDTLAPVHGRPASAREPLRNP